MGLVLYADLLDGGHSVHEGLVDFRRSFLGDGKAEGLGENGGQGIQVPDGVTLGLGGPLRVLPHLFSPHVAEDVAVEVAAHGVRRGRQAPNQIRHLIQGEILFLSPCTEAYAQKKGHGQ